MSLKTSSIAVVIPAAGVGKRMKADCPKQYLKIGDKTILEHTVDKFLCHSAIKLVVVVISANDEYFPTTGLLAKKGVVTVEGGKERVDSVLAGLTSNAIDDVDWVMVHDAARPCVTESDIDLLIAACIEQQAGGLLASPVRDTMKRGKCSDNGTNTVIKTVDRNQLWHAYTPQMYPKQQLIFAIEKGLAQQLNITDESSAIEAVGFDSFLVEGRSDNIKITRPDDLAFAEFILKQQLADKHLQEQKCE